MKALFSVGLIWFVLVVIAVGSWIANIVKIIGHDGPFGLLEIARCIGVIAAPLGVVLGFV